MKGKFIVFSGMDASGKTTNRNHVDMRLNSILGLEYAITREPGGTPFAEDIRERYLLSEEFKFPTIAEALLFYAARVDHTQSLIKPYLDRGVHVLTDRYYDSSLAYQTVFCPETRDVHNACKPFLQHPDLTLLFDVPAEVGLERMLKSRGAGKMDKIEKRGIEYFRKVRDNFLSMANEDPNTVVIDATQPLSVVMDQTWHHVKQCLGLKTDED